MVGLIEWTDVWNFTAVIYRTLALSGCCQKQDQRSVRQCGAETDEALVARMKHKMGGDSHGEEDELIGNGRMREENRAAVRSGEEEEREPSGVKKCESGPLSLLIV